MKFKVALLIFLTAFTCFSCDKASPKKTTLLLDWWANPNHVPLHVGQEKGFFKEEGIDLDILKLAEPPNALSYLCSDRADVAIHYFPQVLKAAAKNDSFKVIGILIKEPLQAFLFKSEQNIFTPLDLDQKILGDAPDGFSAKVIKSCIEKEGKALKDIKKVQFDLVTALMTQQVDIVSGIFWNIEPHQLRHLGVETRFLKFKDFNIPSYEELVFIARDGLIKKDPSFSMRFRKAIAKSIAYCKKNPKAAFEIYLQANPGKDANTIIWEEAAWQDTIELLADDQSFDEKKLQAFYTWLKSKDLIEKDYDVLSLIR